MVAVIIIFINILVVLWSCIMCTSLMILLYHLCFIAPVLWFVTLLMLLIIMSMVCKVLLLMVVAPSRATLVV